MPNWNEILNKYLIKHYDTIKKTTEPIVSYLGIPFFGYHRICENGDYVSLCNRPDWAEYYIDNNFDKNDPFLNRPSSYEGGISFFNTLDSADNENIYTGWKKKLQADEGIVMIEKKSDQAEFFIFAGNQETKDFKNLYLNNISLLKLFCNHFKEKMAFLLEDQKQDNHSLSWNESSLEKTFSFKIAEKEKLLFLKSIGMLDNWRLAETLTAREKECLAELHEGKSMKDIALSMMISPRTVEYHLNNIKNKLNCWSKTELLSFSKMFKALDLLSQ